MFQRALADVSAYRKRKVLSYRFASDRRLSLLAGMLLDDLLCERGLRERDMSYVVGVHGKPSFSDMPNVHFSLAHGGRMALAALADAPVGVDVECLDSFPYDLADPCAWTEMESVGKALGCGIADYLDRDAYVRPPDFEIRHIRIDDNHLACIAQRVQ